MCWRKSHLIAFTLPNDLIDCVLFCFSLYRFSLCVLITCAHFSSLYSHFVSVKMSEMLLRSLSVVLNVTVAILSFSKTVWMLHKMCQSKQHVLIWKSHKPTFYLGYSFSCCCFVLFWLYVIPAIHTGILTLTYTQYHIFILVRRGGASSHVNIPASFVSVITANHWLVSV